MFEHSQKVTLKNKCPNFCHSFLLLEKIELCILLKNGLQLSYFDLVILLFNVNKLRYMVYQEDTLLLTSQNVSSNLLFYLFKQTTLTAPRDGQFLCAKYRSYVT